MIKRILTLLLLLLIFFPGFINSNAAVYTLIKTPKHYYPEVINKEHKVLIETFTATWCGWCHYAYEIFDELKNNYGDKVINIRYHNQDSLSMLDAPERAAYYRVTGYPSIVINGHRKVVGADETSYPDIEEIVKEELQLSSKLGIYAGGVVESNKINLNVEIEQTTSEIINCRFMAILVENNVVYDKDKIFNYVARSVFPSYSGLNLQMDGINNYIINFSIPIDNINKINDYKVILLVEDVDNKIILNSNVFELDSLIIYKTTPPNFKIDCTRDQSFMLYLNDGLVSTSILNNCFEIHSNDSDIISVDFEYDRINRTISLFPRKYLQENTTYALVINSKNGCINSINKKFLKISYILKFRTSDLPKLDLIIDTDSIDFKSINKIDNPSKEMNIVEKHGNPIRFSISASEKWINISKTNFTSANETLKVTVNQLFMKNGENIGFISINSLLGIHFIKVRAFLISDEYPSIIFYNNTFITFSSTYQIYGRTDGYKLTLNEKEILVDNDGYFNTNLKLNKSYNIFTFTAYNLQRKSRSAVLVIIRLK